MSEPVTIDSLLPTHRTDIESIVRATGVFSEAEVAVALEVFDATDDDYEFLGAFRGRELVGYVCFGPTPATDGTFDLYWIAVRPEVQGTGVGDALMNEVELRLSRRNARLLVIETSSRDDYAATRRFYQKRGCQDTARIRDFYAPGDDRVVLTKRLAAPAPIPQPA